MEDRPLPRFLFKARLYYAFFFVLPGQRCWFEAGLAMKDTDIAIIGCGLAGSTAAAILGRAGIPTVLIDPHPVYPFDFRVENLSGDEQLRSILQDGNRGFGAPLGYP